jgi:hypothetical protein
MPAAMTAHTQPARTSLAGILWLSRYTALSAASTRPSNANRPRALLRNLSCLLLIRSERHLTTDRLLFRAIASSHVETWALALNPSACRQPVRNTSLTTSSAKLASPMASNNAVTIGVAYVPCRRTNLVWECETCIRLRRQDGANARPSWLVLRFRISHHFAASSWRNSES